MGAQSQIWNETIRKLEDEVDANRRRDCRSHEKTVELEDKLREANDELRAAREEINEITTECERNAQEVKETRTELENTIRNCLEIEQKLNEANDVICNLTKQLEVKDVNIGETNSIISMSALFR